MKSNISKELIFNHFAGRTSAIQKKIIDDWTKDYSNQELYYTWLDEYELLYPEYNANLDFAVEKYYQRIESKDQVSTTTAYEAIVTKSTIWRKYHSLTWLVAATIIFAIGLITFQTIPIFQYKTYQTEAGETKSLVLSDGSQVTLNANSELKVPRWGFGNHSRTVFLEGEAKFSVTHTASNQKFIVQTPKKFEVEVLGTEFTVFARKRGSKVTLNKGKVRMNVEAKGATKTFTLKPGDKVTLDNDNQEKIQSLKHPEIYVAWQDHRYIFEKTTLLELSYILEDNYDISTEVTNEELLDLTISGTFTANNAIELIDLISKLLDLNIVKEDNHITISKLNF